MGKILSVVIPSYNVEKYIEKCLDSFVELSVLRDIEILIVNDGSTDKTVELASRYERRYPDSFRVLSKENGGHGSTINYAIPQARGKYFKVVDGDDWVDKTLLPDFVRMLKHTDSDMISNDFNLVKDGSGKVMSRRKAVNNKYHYNGVWGFAEAIMDPIVTIHSLTVKTEILKKNSIKLDEHCFYEDQEYIMYPVPYCTSISFSAIALYQYRLGRNGQSVDINMMVNRQDQHMRVLNSLFMYYASFHDLPLYKKQYFERGIAEAVDDEYRIYLAKGSSKENRRMVKKFDLELREKYPGIYNACSRKSVRLLRKSNFRLFGLACLVYKIVR